MFVKRLKTISLELIWNNYNMDDLSRREFLELTGKAAGTAAASGILGAALLFPDRAKAQESGGKNTQGASEVLSLPKGGGAIQGIGETFQANPFSGTANFTVPIATSPGRGGFGPQLSLQYSSGQRKRAVWVGLGLVGSTSQSKNGKGYSQVYG